MMIISRVLLVLLGLMFLGFGLAFLIRPVAVAGWVDIRAESATARTELRAFYGGLEVGLAVFLFAGAAVGGAWLKPALAMGLLASAGPVAGRLTAWAIEGRLERVMLHILLVEILLAVLAGAALTAEWLRR